MNIFDFIDSCVSRKQLPYVRLVTVYTHDGAVTNVCLTRFNDKNIVKKAKRVGLDQDRMMTMLGAGVKIKNFGSYDIQRGDYYLIYDTRSKQITIYKQ